MRAAGHLILAEEGEAEAEAAGAEEVAEEEDDKMQPMLQWLS